MSRMNTGHPTRSRVVFIPLSLGNISGGNECECICYYYATTTSQLDKIRESERESMIMTDNKREKKYLIGILCVINEERKQVK